MLEKVRDGVKKQKEAADGARIAYESSTTVQKQRLDKKMKDDEIDKKLQELKAKKGKKNDSVEYRRVCGMLINLFFSWVLCREEKISVVTKG